MKPVPFTITADLDLGGRVTPYLTDSNPDVRIYEGTVPDKIEGATSQTPAYQTTADEFLLEIPNGLRFYVRGGEEIVYERPADITNREVLLFLLGSAWGALAYQRRLLPLHASAVIHGEDVYAFTGQSGAGKSTLSAALSQRGHSFFSDDVLLVDPASLATGAVCYAGQKDLKLWNDAFELTGAERKTLVRDDEDFDKYYADPNKYSERSSGHMRELYILTSQNARQNKDPIAVDPIKGAISVRHLLTSVYRQRFAMDIIGRGTLFKWLADLIQHVDVYRFDRPVNAKQFAEGADFMSDTIFKKLQLHADLES